MDVQELLDRADIEQTLVTYTRAIDSGDWHRLDGVFTPDAHIDYTSTGGIAGDYPEVKAWLAEMLPIFPRRMHGLHQVDTTLHDDHTATVAAYFFNPMGMPQADGPDHLVELGGIYHHDFVRTPDGWRSRRLLEELVWKRGL